MPNAIRLKRKLNQALVPAAAVVATAGALMAPFASSETASLAIINNCGLDGKEAHGSEHALENALKNRYTFPSDPDLLPPETLNLQTMLTANQASSFDTSRAGTIEGYITEVKPGGVESCNCGTSDPPYMDTHIYVAANATDAKRRSVIVEVTPRIRMLMQAKGIDWSTTALKHQYEGKKVRISGWLFYDAEHENASENIKVRPHNWRGTCWEIHPVTGIQLAP